MAKFAVQYVYDPALAGERAKVLEEHRAWLADLDDQGTLLTAGAYTDGTGALLAFAYDDLAAAEAAADGDPYHKAGLVAERTIREWNVRWGALA